MQDQLQVLCALIGMCLISALLSLVICHSFSFEI